MSITECFKGLLEQTGSRDVSDVTEMVGLFVDAKCNCFSTCLLVYYTRAKEYEVDLSKWDVSRVTGMHHFDEPHREW